MNRFKSITLLFLSIVWILSGCGNDKNIINDSQPSLTKGYLMDSPVSGVTYECGSIKGITTSAGEFECSVAPITFKIGGYVLGSIETFTSDGKVYPQDLLGLPRTDFESQKLVDLTRLLQSLDDDGNIDEFISIPQNRSILFDASSNGLTLTELAQIAGVILVSPESAIDHLREQMQLQDIIPPVVTAPTNISVVATSESGIAASDESIAAFLSGANATDNVEVVGAVSNDAPATFPVGVTTVVFSAVDAEGNIGTASATVTVSSVNANDTIPPVVTAPVNISVVATSESGIAESDEAIAAFLAGASATDNVEVMGAVTNNAPAIFPVGVTTVTFTAVDAEGNTGTASATVTVTGPSNGGGTCVTLPRVGTGSIYTLKNVNIPNSTTVNVETTVVEFGETFGKFTTVVTGDFESTGEKTETWSIANNYLDITKVVTKDTSVVPGVGDVVSDITLEFSPYLRQPFDTVCEGEIHTATFELTTTGTVYGYPSPTINTQNNWITTIESVNETKVIGLGSFTAVKTTLERSITSNGSTTKDRIITWIDTETGHVVATEEYDSSGTKISTQELIYHN